MSRDRAASVLELQPVSWERMIRAVEKVRERLLKATAALEAARVPYAVTGGNSISNPGMRRRITNDGNCAWTFGFCLPSIFHGVEMTRSEKAVACAKTVI